MSARGADPEELVPLGVLPGGADPDVVGRASGSRELTSRTDVFGVPCFRGTLEEATALVVSEARSGSGGYACLCNVHVLETARRDFRVMAALREALVVFPDGAPIAWVQRLTEPGAGERVGGPDLMERVFRDGCAVGLRHALYGSTEEVLEGVRATFERRYPLAQVVAAISPPFGPRTDEEIVRDLDALRSARPHVIWVALGAPRQELWAARFAPALEPALLVGVGAAFDFIAGSKRRAPAWMQEASLEWLHRLATEPRRLGIRYLSTNSRFLVRVGAGLARRRIGRRRAWS